MFLIVSSDTFAKERQPAVDLSKFILLTPCWPFSHCFVLHKFKHDHIPITSLVYLECSLNTRPLENSLMGDTMAMEIGRSWSSSVSLWAWTDRSISIKCTSMADTWSCHFWSGRIAGKIACPQRFQQAPAFCLIDHQRIPCTAALQDFPKTTRDAHGRQLCRQVSRT